MARLIVALAALASVEAFLAPSAPTAAPKTVVFGKGGELRDRKLQCWILHEIVAVSPPLHRTLFQQQALQPSSWLRKRDAKKRPPRDKTPAAPRPPKVKKIKSHPRASRRDEASRRQK